MSEDKPESDATDTAGEEGISDDQLPADVQPTEDNPLARHPEQTGDEDDEIGTDREGEARDRTLTEEDADYGGGSEAPPASSD